MSRVLAAFVAAFIVACSTTTPAAPPVAGPSSSNIATRQTDGRCARDTFVTFLTAVNKGNRTLLTPMLGDSFMWLTIAGTTTYDRLDAIERLLGVSRLGHQWELRSIEVNGRGWHGGIDVGVIIRRIGPGVPSPVREARGNGAIDCPDRRIRLFGLGDTL